MYFDVCEGVWCVFLLLLWLKRVFFLPGVRYFSIFAPKNIIYLIKSLQAVYDET